MQSSNLVPVTGKDGRLGAVDPTAHLDSSEKHVLVQLDNGRPVWVPFDLLDSQPDGSYYLPLTRQQLDIAPEAQWNKESAPVLVIPVIEEELAIGREVSTSRVKVAKRVHEEERLVDEPGYLEEVEIERIPRNEVLEGPASTYYDGDTLVIPIVAEELVVEKRLVLREEVRITKQRKEVRKPERVTLRREEVTVQRTDQEG